MHLPVDVKKEIVSQLPHPQNLLPPYPDGTKLQFHFKTWILDNEDQIVDDTRSMGVPMTLILGKQFKLPVWENMLQTMIPGQVAKFNVPKHHLTSYPMVSKAMRETASGERTHSSHCCGMMSQGIGYTDLDKLMEKPQDLTFLFELLTTSAPGDYEKESWQLSEGEKLASIPILQAEGNTLFSLGNYHDAEHKYFEAIARLEQLLLKEHPTSQEAGVIQTQKVPLLLNYALCLMKRNDFYQAITHLDTAIKLQPENVKGLFRRGKCHQAVGGYKEARLDFGQALKLDPSLAGAVSNLEQQMIRDQKRRDAQDKNKFKRIFQDEGGETHQVNKDNA